MKTRAIALIWIAALGALPVSTLITVQRADAAPTVATWQWGAPFEIAYASSGADVDVVRGDIREAQVGGKTWRDEDGDRVVGCTIVVGHKRVTPAVLAHELGHCLGLAGHSDHPGDLMYAVTGGPLSATGVTDADRAALADLYAEVK